MRLSFQFLLLGLVSVASASGGHRVLALLDNLSIKESHSIFFKSLQDLGLEVTFRVADDPTILLKKYGSFLYDHLILFSPTVEEFGGTLTVEGVTDFVDNGGNVLVAGNSNTGDILREFASECGFEADEEGTSVIDHLNFDIKDSGKHTLVVVDPDNLIKSAPIVGNAEIGPILYEGTGLIADRANPLVLEILTASSSAYSHNPDQAVTEYPHAIGKNTLLVAGLQARNNARVVFSGSLDLFSDAFFNSAVLSQDGKFKADKSGNLAFAQAVSKWCFRMAGVLRVVSVDHRLDSDPKGSPPSSYTIKITNSSSIQMAIISLDVEWSRLRTPGVRFTKLKDRDGRVLKLDDVVFTIEIEEFKDGKWIAYNANDIQLEFVRIDPFVRLTLTPNAGKFVGKFRIPDVYGVYQFKVDYVRTGLIRLFSATQYSVRPLRHDQYERFILSAAPYYASTFSMMFGVFVFSFVFIHFKDEPFKSKSD